VPCRSFLFHLCSLILVDDPCSDIHSIIALDNLFLFGDPCSDTIILSHNEPAIDFVMHIDMASQSAAITATCCQCIYICILCQNLWFARFCDSVGRCVYVYRSNQQLILS
jgi:hypothetical protein